jgi:protein required for attachment to host cells
MTAGKRLWVVVADGARARFFVAGPETRGFAPTGPGALSSHSAHGHAHDLKSDKPGRTFGSGNLRHAIEPKHDYHKMEKHKFSRVLAETLDQAYTARAFDHLLLVAPRRSLGELRILLSEQVKASIKEIVAKDLTGNTDEELWTKLAPAVGRLSAQQ